MAITIVGVNTAATAGAVDIIIPLPAGVASGDEVLLHLKFRRTAGTSTTATTPSGFTKVGNTADLAVFQKIYTTTPPANVTVTFANSDTHCLAQSVAWHGGFDDGQGSTIRSLSVTEGAATSGANILSPLFLEYPGSMLLSLYATSGAGVTVPTEQTGLYAGTQVGPPALGIASSYEMVTVAGAVDGESVSLSAATSLMLVQITIIPATAVSIYDAHWVTPLGPYPQHDTVGYVIFDPDTDYAYYVGQDNSDGTGIITVRKIERSTFTVIDSATYSGHRGRRNKDVTQDATALYIALYFDPVFSLIFKTFIKILKSDLSLVYVATNAPDVEAVFDLRMGKSGTWTADQVWTLGRSHTTGNFYLVSWDLVTGAYTSRTSIPFPAISPGSPDGTGAQDGKGPLVLDDNGDIWIQTTRSGASTSTLVLMHVTVGPTFATPKNIMSVRFFGSDVWTSTTYDSVTDSLILLGHNGGNGNVDVIARYDIATDTIIYNTTYSSGLVLSESRGLPADGNGLRNFLGIPSVFTGWSVDSSGWGTASNSWRRHHNIAQHNYETGDLIRFFEMQGVNGLLDTYGAPHEIFQSPENDLWMTSRDGIGGEYLHKLDLTAAIAGADSQGWITWAEMQIPPTQTAFQRPAYGRGYGLGYGGAGPYLHPGTGDQFGRPSADTFIGTYTDAAAGVTNIYQSLDEPTLNDADYITSVSAPSNAVYATKLTPLTDPLISTGHIVRYRYKKEGGTSVQLDLVVQLRQGYVNEGTLGTLIKEWTHADISTTFVTATQTLTGGEADAITDYASLFKRFRFNQV